MDESRTIGEIMSQEADDMAHRMAVAKMMQEDFKENPPDMGNWVKILEGCSQLLQIASHKAKDEDYREMLRILTVIDDTLQPLRQDAYMAYVLSSQASEDFLTALNEAHKDRE